MFKKYVLSLYLSTLFYGIFIAINLLAVLAFFIPILRPAPFLFYFIFAFLFTFDYLALYSRDGITATRQVPERLSNGDDNTIVLRINNTYAFSAHLTLIDEVPVQLQNRSFSLLKTVEPAAEKEIQYTIRPLKRGDYEFGTLNIYTRGPLKLISRRFWGAAGKVVPVFPSFLQMRQYSLMAVSQYSSRYGIRKIRRVGHSREYDEIHEYVQGDDVRTINWKASARNGNLMVNHYNDEKAQQIYCVIDKGRAMKTPVNGLSLLDYAINASLVLASIALQNKDRAGLVTYSDVMGTFLPADAKPRQLDMISDLLHNEKSRFLESSAELLYAYTRRRITQRSLIVLFTHFDSVTALVRELPYLKKINTYHLLLVVFFQDTELKQILEKPAPDLLSIYTRTIAGKFALEKRLILNELRQAGILGLLTKPATLTLNALNKYLEIKQRNLI